MYHAAVNTVGSDVTENESIDFDKSGLKTQQCCGIKVACSFIFYNSMPVIIFSSVSVLPIVLRLQLALLLFQLETVRPEKRWRTEAQRCELNVG